jgi:hypothetical protein
LSRSFELTNCDSVDEKEIEELLFCEFVLVLPRYFLQLVEQSVRVNIVKVVKKVKILEELFDGFEGDGVVQRVFQFLINFIDHFSLIDSEIFDTFICFAFLYFLLSPKHFAVAFL